MRPSAIMSFFGPADLSFEVRQSVWGYSPVVRLASVIQIIEFSAEVLYPVCRGEGKKFLKASTRGSHTFGFNERLSADLRRCARVRSNARHLIQPMYMRASANRVAHQFVNNRAYIAHVLDGSPIPPPAHEPAVPPEWSMALVSVFAAIAIAGTHSTSAQARDASAKLAGPFRVLHRLHSGHVGDYVVFLTLGMACFGLICAYCVR